MLMTMLTLNEWNRQQVRIFRRYSRLHGVPLTPDLFTLLARRFARKHADDRRYLDAGTQFV
jgi:hypothetical protein